MSPDPCKEFSIKTNKNNELTWVFRKGYYNKHRYGRRFEMVNKNILARIEKEYLEEEKEDLEAGLPAQKCKLIIHYLNNLPSRHIINVMPSLCRASCDRKL